MPLPKPAQGYVEACPGNLPVVDLIMLIDFLGTPSLQEPELRHVKTLKSTRESYGDNAIGYVQIKRDEGKCHVMGKVSPEHKVNNTPYQVHVLIDEKEEIVVEAYCSDCAGSADCCKHAVAFVTWLHRESEKKSVTEVQSYWHRSKLAQIKTSNPEDMRLEKMVKQRVASIITEDIAASQEKAFHKDLLKSLEKNKSCSSLLKQHISVKFSYAIHHLLIAFINAGHDLIADNFLTYCSQRMENKECRKLARKTANQADDSLWYDLRCSRVTGSKIHEASRCKTEDGVTVNSVMGVHKFKETTPMKRGKEMEPQVRRAFEKLKGIKVTCTGFVMKGEHPAFGASPDGLTKTHIVEIKCPIKMETFNTYFKDATASSLEPAPQKMAQMDLQMKMCDRSQGYFIVAHPDFKDSGLMKIAEVTLDTGRCDSLMLGSLEFWKKFIFPKLVKSILGYLPEERRQRVFAITSLDMLDEMYEM